MAFRPINIVGQGLPPVAVSTGSVSLLFPVAFVFPLVLSKFQIEMCYHPDRPVWKMFWKARSTVFGLVHLPL